MAKDSRAEFRRIADAAFGLMERAARSPRGAVRAYARAFDEIAEGAYDAVAAVMLGDDFNVEGRRDELRRKLRDAREAATLTAADLGEGAWFVMPALGVGNDLSGRSGGGALFNGVTPLPNMVPADGWPSLQDEPPAFATATLRSSDAVVGDRALAAEDVERHAAELLGD